MCKFDNGYQFVIIPLLFLPSSRSQKKQNLSSAYSHTVSILFPLFQYINFPVPSAPLEAFFRAPHVEVDYVSFDSAPAVVCDGCAVTLHIEFCPIWDDARIDRTCAVVTPLPYRARSTVAEIICRAFADECLTVVDTSRLPCYTCSESEADMFRLFLPFYKFSGGLYFLTVDIFICIFIYSLPRLALSSDYRS